MYRYVGMKISILRIQLQYIHVHALFNGAHVAIMFPCDNHNLFNETYVIMLIIIPNKNTSYGRCAYTSAVSPK